MSNVINLGKVRARLGRDGNRPMHRRARPLKRSTREAGGSFRDLGSISAEILRRLSE